MLRIIKIWLSKICTHLLTLCLMRFVRIFRRSSLIILPFMLWNAWVRRKWKFSAWIVTFTMRTKKTWDADELSHIRVWFYVNVKTDTPAIFQHWIIRFKPRKCTRSSLHSYATPTKFTPKHNIYQYVKRQKQKNHFTTSRIVWQFRACVWVSLVSFMLKFISWEYDKKKSLTQKKKLQNLTLQFQHQRTRRRKILNRRKNTEFFIQKTTIRLCIRVHCCTAGPLLVVAHGIPSIRSMKIHEIGPGKSGISSIPSEFEILTQTEWNEFSWNNYKKNKQHSHARAFCFFCCASANCIWIF